jgi:hypothetical protein
LIGGSESRVEIAHDDNPFWTLLPGPRKDRFAIRRANGGKIAATATGCQAAGYLRQTGAYRETLSRPGEGNEKLSEVT